MRPVLDEERGLVEHHLGARASVTCDRGGAGGGDARMGDALEIGARAGVREDDRAEPLAVERPVGRQDGHPEARDQLGERGLSRLDDLARDQVGIDDRGAACGELLRNRALARRDTTREPDDVRHAAKVAHGADLGLRCGVLAPRTLAVLRLVGGLVVGPSVALLGVTAHAARRDWTGTAACGSCHPAELAAWRTTAHATTAVRFGAAGPPPGQCLACHGTGEAPAGPAVAVGVGCESCHGAGAAYASDDVMRDRPVALALGMVALSTPAARAAVCMACHARITTSRPFDPNAPVHPIAKAVVP